LIVVLVAIIGIAVMLFAPFIVYNFSIFSDNVGFAAHSVYPTFSAPESGFSINGNSLSVSDTAIYKTGYYSINGANWQNFTLSGTILNGSWLSSSATYTLPNFGSGESYVVIYTCTKTSGAWNCHDNKWQLQIINNTGTTNSGSKTIIYAAGRFGDGAYPTMELIIDNNVVASWIVDGDVETPKFNAYYYNHTSVIDKNSAVRVNYPNDVWGSIRDLRVDKIVIDNVTYESESPSNINTGQSDGTRCGGYDSPGNEWLVCSGYIQYNLSSTSPPACTPVCSNKQCGSDGCSGTCGTCLSTQTCDSNGACINNAVAPFCGDNQCNGNETCSSCSRDCSACQSYSRTFYVSSSTGNDNTGDGSINKPWQTISKINAQTFKAGDGILFKRGDTWHETLTVSSSGSSAASITYSAYGTGEKPIITGFTTITGWTNEGNEIYSKGVSSESSPEMVTINGLPYGMGRYPDEGTWLYFESHDGTESITDNELPSSPDWTGAEIVIRNQDWAFKRGIVDTHSGHTLRYSPKYYGDEEPHDGWGYFFQNDLRTLTKFGEWYYDDSNSKLYMYFGSNNPNNYRVQVSSIDKLVTFDQNEGYITFDNIQFAGANDRSLDISANKYITIKNCDIEYSGIFGIYADNSNNIKIINTTLNYSNDEGIYTDGLKDTIISGCTINNTGTIIGLGGENVILEYNNICNSGYSGMNFGSTNGIVRNNVIDRYCFNLVDGAGIYYGSQTASTNLAIYNNIVLNGVGGNAGRPLGSPLEASNGIYIDFNTLNGVKIYNNTVKDCKGGGIYVHESQNIDIYDNKVYDCTEAARYQDSGLGITIRDIFMKGNIFVATDSSQLTMWARTHDVNNDFNQWGDFDYNYYLRTTGDDKSIGAFIYDWSGASSSLAEWNALSGQDSHSHDGSTTLANSNGILFEYNPTRTNKVITLSGNYVDVKGASYSGSVTIAPYTSIFLIKH
jgi:parallel beta-helix repeat protein